MDVASIGDAAEAYELSTRLNWWAQATNSSMAS